MARKYFSENVLIVNGQTNQPAGSTAVIWSQQIVLPSAEVQKEADYRLCFRYLQGQRAHWVAMARWAASAMLIYFVIESSVSSG